MTAWRRLLGENRELYSSIGVRPLDEFTGRPPAGRVRALLDARDGGGVWLPTRIPAVASPGGVFVYPMLERRAAAGGAPRRYRVRLEAQFYVPRYREFDDGIEFDVHPYNDTVPPQVITSQAANAFLLPAANYPFPTSVRVLHGRAVDVAGLGVADVTVSEDNRERVLTDQRGEFALPLRWVQDNVLVAIDAIHQRTGRTGQINVTLPGALGHNQQIIIT
jgi:hypothetical protein